MADRAGSEGDPGVPKEVFELDKDERWQARLDEARARREIALREKAAGRPQKPRPKPWEIEGAAVEKPPKIEPVIQERGDDKFDFADRLETIRETKAGTAPQETAARTPEAPKEVPPRARESVSELRRKPAPEPRARPQPSLILPGAPDVADLAARYAATLEKSAPPEPETPEARAPGPRTADLVALPTSARPTAGIEAKQGLSRAERRRGIRPLGMAVALLALAALPLSTEAPPLETGPEMPAIDVLRIQPALGVTWSLYEKPFQTRAGEWTPGRAPSRLGAVPLSEPATLLDSVALPPEPVYSPTGSLNWTEVAPVIIPPKAEPSIPDAAFGNAPDLGGAPVPPLKEPTETVMPDSAGAVAAPPRPATLSDEDRLSPAAPEAPAARPGMLPDTVVEGDPLRVTILAPTRVERSIAEDIASNVQNDGHELVRVLEVEFGISERNLRYFHDADRAAAARMAERYDAELRDFTWLRPKPVEGTAELWLAGRAPSGNTSGRVQPSAGVSVDSGEQRDFLGRVFDRLGLGTELPDTLPSADGLRPVLPGLRGFDN